jgi:eukaryotic-like serine/threonine-protein kinase
MLGKYQLIAELARGGMGVVYLAVNSGLGGFNKLLVIKELKPELVEDHGFLEMFLEEARLAARLNHPNIVPTYEVGMEGNRPFIVMDYLDGQTLARVLRKKIEGLSVHKQLRIITLALEGLQYAHRLEDFDGSVTNVVHRDVSPQNIFVTYDGQVKVVDFGIAKASDTTVETRTGVFKGKPSYMAPEQLQGDTDPRSDVFAIGIMIWEAIAGRRMWQKKTDVEILTALLKGAIPDIDEAAPESPEELRRICKKAVAANIDDRYASAKDLREDVDAYLESVGDRSTLKDIGALIATGFQEQREKIRGIIERCIAESKSGAASSRSKLPSITPADESSGPSGPSKPSKPGRVSPTLRVEAAPNSAPQSLLTGTPAGATIDAPRDDQPPKKSVFGVVVVGAVLVAGVAGAIALGARKSEAAKEPPLVAAGLAPSPSPAPSPRPSPSAAAAETPPPAASSTPQESASAPSTKAASPPARAVMHVTPPVPRPAAPPPAKPVVTVAPAPSPTPSPAAPSAKPDCNPPFYFEGTKKVFKPGCL